MNSGVFDYSLFEKIEIYREENREENEEFFTLLHVLTLTHVLTSEIIRIQKYCRRHQATHDIEKFTSITRNMQAIEDLASYQTFLW